MIDFNDVPISQPTGKFEQKLIPAGTICWCQFTFKAGDSQKNPGLTVSKNATSESLNARIIVRSSAYAGVSFFQSIMVESASTAPNMIQAKNIGKAIIRKIIDSCYELKEADRSPQATAKRRINSWDDLQNLVFLAQINTEVDNFHLDANGKAKLKNKIGNVYTPDSKIYQQYIVDKPWVEEVPTNLLSNQPSMAPSQPASAQVAPDAWS